MDDFLKEIYFPYNSLRRGQGDFISKVFKSISHKKNVMVSAPTGLGKTISALAPALHFAKKNNLSIIYLTSRQTQANQVIKTIKDVNEKSKEPINYVGFIGKRSMCVHEERDLYPAQDFNDFCRKMKEKGKCKYFKNSKNEEYAEQVKSIIDESSKSFMSVEGFVDMCYSNRFCPYEIAGAKAFKADVIICDYNYLFSSGIRENFLGKIGRTLEECVIVVDEAHNLPDRVRAAYSHNLNSEMISNALKEMNDFVKSSEFDCYISNALECIEEIIFKKLDGNKEALINREDFIELYLSKFSKTIGLLDIIDKLKDIEMLVREDRVVSHIGRFASFLEKYNDLDEESFLRTVEKYESRGKDVLSLRIKCIDPSDISSQIVNHTYSSIFMSGTLSPIEMYKDILGVANTSLLELKSPFPEENQKMLVLDNVTTKYSARTPQMYQLIAKQVEESLNAAHSKNAIVFFPSYILMEKIVELISIKNLDRKILREKRYMTKEDKETFVERFKDKGGWNEKSKVLFAVTSGSFSEGLDLPEDMLEMVIVVGLPLSVPDLSTNAVIRHFDKKFRKGQLYGYIYPAMTKIIQAAGRCIRTEGDKGVIVLMDNRFLWPLYAQSFPAHWKMVRTKNHKYEIEKFFE